MSAFRHCLRPKTLQLFVRRISNDVFEPPYLEAMKPKIPLYDAINIQLRGYDYAVLESYQGYVHKLAKNLELEVSDAWGVPAQNMQITTYKPNSEIVNSQYNLNIYQRSIQLVDVPTTQLPLLLRAIEACTPAGVSISVLKHEEHHEKERYVPDKDLLDLKQELEDMASKKK